MKQYAPIVIPTLCRYEHLLNCIESLLKNSGVAKTELYISVDYPARDNHWIGYNRILKYIETIKGFKKVHILKCEKNKGAIENSNYLLEYVSREHDRFIFTEDDNVFSPAFIEFMNQALEIVQKNDKLIGVCGYAYPFLARKGEAETIQQGVAFPCWGYGMFFETRNKLREYIKAGKLLVDFEVKREEVKRKSRYNYDLLVSACRAYPQTPDGEYYELMDLSLSAYMLINNKRTIMPTESLVRNCGWDGTGEHCKREEVKKKSVMLEYGYEKQKIYNGFELNVNDVIDFELDMEKLWYEYTKEYKNIKKRIELWIKEKSYFLLGRNNYIFFKRKLIIFHNK